MLTPPTLQGLKQIEIAAVGATHIEVRWPSQNSSQADLLVIFRTMGMDGETIIISRNCLFTVDNYINCVISNLTSNKLHTFKLIICEENQKCCETDTNFVTTLPAIPYDLQISELGSSSVKLSWKTGRNAAGDSNFYGNCKSHPSYVASRCSSSTDCTINLLANRIYWCVVLNCGLAIICSQSIRIYFRTCLSVIPRVETIEISEKIIRFEIVAASNITDSHDVYLEYNNNLVLSRMKCRLKHGFSFTCLTHPGHTDDVYYAYFHVCDQFLHCSMFGDVQFLPSDISDLVSKIQFTQPNSSSIESRDTDQNMHSSTFYMIYETGSNSVSELCQMRSNIAAVCELRNLNAFRRFNFSLYQNQSSQAVQRRYWISISKNMYYGRPLVSEVFCPKFTSGVRRWE